MHLRAPTGTRIENTARVADEVERVIRETIPQQELLGIVDNIGLPTSGINLAYSNSGTIGSFDAEVLVSLEANHHPTEEYVEPLREKLPALFPGTTFFFQPADIVAQILNFGLPAPIDVQIIGNDIRTNFSIAEKVAQQIRQVPGTVDTHVYQLENQPQFLYAVDRNKSNQLGLRERDIASKFLPRSVPAFRRRPIFGWIRRTV